MLASGYLPIPPRPQQHSQEAEAGWNSVYFTHRITARQSVGMAAKDGQMNEMWGVERRRSSTARPGQWAAHRGHCHFTFPGAPVPRCQPRLQGISTGIPATMTPRAFSLALKIDSPPASEETAQHKPLPAQPPASQQGMAWREDASSSVAQHLLWMGL